MTMERPSRLTPLSDRPLSESNEHTVYAGWTSTITYTVIYNPNGGEGSVATRRCRLDASFTVSNVSFATIIKNGVFMKKLLFLFLALILVFSLTACSQTPPDNEDIDNNGGNGAGEGDSHTHSYAQVWEQNDESHWHKCTVDGCTATSGLEGHLFGSWVTVEDPTPQNDGVRERVCTVCLKLVSEPVKYGVVFSEEDFVELFVFDNVRITYEQTEDGYIYDILVDGDEVAIVTDGGQFSGDRSELAFVNFAEYYTDFDYDENTLVSNSTILLTDDYGSYRLTDVIIILGDGRIESITYTIDYGDVLGTACVSYTFRDWGEVEITEVDVTLSAEDYAELIDASRYVNFTTEVEGYDKDHEETLSMQLLVDEEGYYQSVDLAGMIVGQYFEEANYGPVYMELLFAVLDGISAADFVYDSLSGCWYYGGVVVLEDGTNVTDIYLSAADGMIEELSYTELDPDTEEVMYTYNIFYSFGETDAANAEQGGTEDGVSNNTYPREKWDALFDIQNVQIDCTDNMSGTVSASTYFVDGELVVIVSDDITTEADRSELSAFDFTNYYGYFIYDGEGVFTADSLQVSLGSGVSFEYTSVTVKISGDRLSEISYTVSLMGMTIKEKYVFSKWGEVEVLSAVTATQHEEYLSVISDTAKMAECTEISRDECNDDETYYVSWYYEITDTGYDYYYYSSTPDGEVSNEGSMEAENYAIDYTAPIRDLLYAISADDLAYCQYTDTYIFEGEIIVGNTAISNIKVMFADGYIDGVSYCQLNEDGTVVFVEEYYWY